MKKLIAFVLLSLPVWGQANKAVAIIDGMQKKYKSMGSFSANFSYQTDGGNALTGSITVKGTKFRLKTSGQEIFNNGKEVSTYIKEINEVNISSFDPADGDLNPAKIYTFDKKGYKFTLVGETGGVATVEMAPTAKSAQVKSVSMKINTADFTVKSWVIINKSGKKQSFTVTKLNSKAGVDDAYFTFNKKSFPGVEVNDLR
jgi:outer membrane lipoprotein-sorting protein